MKIIKSFLILTVAILGFAYVDISAKNIPANDSEINEKKVGSKILGLPFYGVFDLISYEIKGNTVVLSGKVINAVNRKSAERSIRKIAGVENVENNIEVLPPSRFDDSIRFRTLRTIQQRGSLFRYFLGTNSSIKIIVDRGHVTLEGFVRTKGDSRLAYIQASQVPGVFSVTNNLVATKLKR